MAAEVACVELRLGRGPTKFNSASTSAECAGSVEVTLTVMYVRRLMAVPHSLLISSYHILLPTGISVPLLRTLLLLISNMGLLFCLLLLLGYVNPTF